MHKEYAKSRNKFDQPAQRKKPTPTVVSKFKKTKKRRFSGYYSSAEAVKCIKYVNTDANTEFLKNVASSSNVKKKMPRIEMEAPVVPQCLDTSAVKQNSFYKVTFFCSVLWRLPFIDPTADLTQQAAIISDNHQLTWLDVHTINALPSSNVYAAITSYYGSSGKGWVSKNVVDAYMHSTVRKANQIKQEEKFGSLDCDHSSLVISHGKIKNLAVFARRILVTGTKQLCSNIFLLVLYANHFILIWFCKISCHTDSSSCGICVCIVSEKLCDFLLNSKTICPTDKILYSFKFRHLIAFNLFARSMQCSQLMNAAAAENYYNTAIGLTNIGDTCWFNSVIQAVTAVLQNSSQKIDNPNLNADMMILANIINTLLKHEPVDDKILLNAVVGVCNFCKFEFGKEQDPEEFFALSSLTDLLSVNGSSCISQLQVDIQCTSCNDVVVVVGNLFRFCFLNTKNSTIG